MKPTDRVMIALMDGIRRENPLGSERDHQAALRAKVQANPALEKLLVEEVYRGLIKKAMH
jgi:hypothetical protein